MPRGDPSRGAHGESVAASEKEGWNLRAGGKPRLKLALEFTRREEAGLRSMKSHGLVSEAGIVRVALRHLLREWDLTPEHASPGVATREELAAELHRELRGG